MASVWFFRIRPNRERMTTPEAAKLGADDIKIDGERLRPGLLRLAREKCFFYVVDTRVLHKQTG